jgi:F-type H+-transporting ATPase subunit epsilon
MAETHPKFDVALVTPEGETFRGEAEMLIVPGAAGEIGVLARHAPLVATLKAGSTRVYRDRASEDVLEFATGPGFFKAELEKVERGDSTADRWQLEQRILHAENQLTVAGRN